MSHKDIQAGVIVKTKFCIPKSRKFQSYIDYIDRDEAIRNKHNVGYNLFADYMGNPKKTTGLFTAQSDMLSVAEKKSLKKVMSEAQEQGSLMWQTVISFDNRWLEKNGIYDSKMKILDEQKLKSIVRTSVNKMLKNENLDNATWSAAIHFNTDNIHVHIATVEPVPMREKKEYVQYQYKNNKREPILNPEGNPVKKKEYVGRFKPSSISICKSSVVNQILNERESNLKINQIIRGSILAQKKETLLYQDENFRQSFLKLYSNLPDVNRSLWKYNSNVMTEIRPQIDKLTTAYIKAYHEEDYAELQKNLKDQESVYKEAYGDSKSGNDYADHKIQDLYARMGNAILKELRDYDRQISREEKRIIYDRSSGDTRAKREKIYSGWRLSTVLKKLDMSLKREYEKKNNEWEHEQLIGLWQDERGI